MRAMQKDLDPFALRFITLWCGEQKGDLKNI
jgi:hypothetical protein